MANFSGLFNYSKPGKGVSKQNNKYRFVIFMEIFFRKFWQLIVVNLMGMGFFSIPYILVGGAALIATKIQGVGIETLIPNSYVYLLLYLPLAFAGPIIAGVTFILRNYAREEHAFIWADFKDTIKKNWKQSLAVSVIYFLFIIILSVALPFYFQNIPNSSFWYIPFVICIFVATILLFSSYYIYTMLITFKYSFKQLVKNAVIFSFLGLGRNLLLTIGLFLTWSIVVYLALNVHLIVSMVLVFLIIPAFSGLLINFSIYPMLQKYIIKPFEEKEKIQKSFQEKDENDNKEEKQIFTDRG